jgi:hypothetical protein
VKTTVLLGLEAFLILLVLIEAFAIGSALALYKRQPLLGRKFPVIFIWFGIQLVIFGSLVVLVSFQLTDSAMVRVIAVATPLVLGSSLGFLLGPKRFPRLIRGVDRGR